MKNILKEPYAVKDAVTDELVEVLLTPLLTAGAADVVFDTLSYSAGPLPEDRARRAPGDLPVWVCYGGSDPWTPPKRVDARGGSARVEEVGAFAGVGHARGEAPGERGTGGSMLEFPAGAGLAGANVAASWTPTSNPRR